MDWNTYLEEKMKSSQPQFYAIKALCLVVSDKKIFFKFSLYEPMLNMWPRGQVHFWPKGYNLNKLGRGPLGDATYKISTV